MDYHEMSNSQNINYRKSGFLLSGIVAVIYVTLFLQGKNHPYVAAAAVVLAVMALFEALPLRKTITLFIGFGNFMHRFTNPLIFGIVYLVAVIPTALVLTLFGKDVLRLRYNGKIASYWQDHTNGKAWKESFRIQF